MAPADGPGNNQPLSLPQIYDMIQRRFSGELPEKLQRELLLQSSIEEFLPAYAPMIEEYYRHLLDEKGKQKGKP